jgi:hypothetical protein
LVLDVGDERDAVDADAFDLAVGVVGVTDDGAAGVDAVCDTPGAVVDGVEVVGFGVAVDEGLFLDYSAVGVVAVGGAGTVVGADGEAADAVGAAVVDVLDDFAVGVGGVREAVECVVGVGAGLAAVRAAPKLERI